jgi:WD40 repeat protein
MGPPLPGDGRPVYAVRFSPDSSTLVSGGSGGAVSLWDVSDPGGPRQIGEPLSSTIGSVNTVAFGGAAPWLAAGGGSGGTAVWDLSWLQELRTRAVERACAVVGRGFDQDEWASRVPGVDYQDSCRGRS